jgi:hypothetical protein
MKAKSSLGQAAKKAQGWKSDSWESKLCFLLKELNTFRAEVRDLKLESKTAENKAFLKTAKRLVRERAGSVGVLIAQELLKGNDEVLRMAHEGLQNIRKGKAFMPSKSRSEKAMRVLHAVFFFTVESGRKPTSSEIAEITELPRSTVSEAVKLIGIEDRLSDGRQERHKKARLKP